jgi:hypothetical protein
MSLLHTLRTVRAMRVVALLGYLLVVATSGVTPWMQPMAFGNICSAAGNDTDRDHGIGCALCLPAAAPPLCPPVASLAHEPADAYQLSTNHPLLEARAAVMPPARAPPAV